MQVRVLKSKDGNSLVEWKVEGNIFRTWVPAGDVIDGEVQHPERGLLYGDDLVHQLTMPTSADLEQALHNQGLWTREDMAHNPQQVMAALSNAFSNVVTFLLSR